MYNKCIILHFLYYSVVLWLKGCISYSIFLAYFEKSCPYYFYIKDKIYFVVVLIENLQLLFDPVLVINIIIITIIIVDVVVVVNVFILLLFSCSSFLRTVFIHVYYLSYCSVEIKLSLLFHTLLLSRSYPTSHCNHIIIAVVVVFFFIFTFYQSLYRCCLNEVFLVLLLCLCLFVFPTLILLLDILTVIVIVIIIIIIIVIIVICFLLPIIHFYYSQLLIR